MIRELLFVNREGDQEPELEPKDSGLNHEIEYSNKEELLKIISALMDSNEALRKYIELLEKNNNPNYITIK